MKTIALGVFILLATSTVLESCSQKLCPAYGTNPKTGEK